jgi:hypothetical protein
VTHDYRSELRTLDEAVEQVNRLVRLFLGDRERAYTFTRYLESVLPEDAARGRLLKEQLTQDTPEESLFLLRNAFGSYQDLIEGALRLPRVGPRLYQAVHGSLSREVGRNAFFNPLVALEFRPEFDRIRDPVILDLLAKIELESVHRVVALVFLTLFRALRYLDLVDRYAFERSRLGRAFVILAVLRSDLRTLTRYVGQRAGHSLAEGLERSLMTLPRRDLATRGPQLGARAEALVGVRNALEATAGGLRVDLRKIYQQDLPSPADGVSDPELLPRLVPAVQALRASLHHAIGRLARALDPASRPPRLAPMEPAKTAARLRRRREVWTVMQILRAFIAKAEAAIATPHAAGVETRWEDPVSYQFVRDFLGHFRSLGYPLVVANGYPDEAVLLAALRDLRDLDVRAPSRLATAARECQSLYTFFGQLYDRLTREGELGAFDRHDAIAYLKVYLGRV